MYAMRHLYTDVVNDTTPVVDARCCIGTNEQDRLPLDYLRATIDQFE